MIALLLILVPLIGGIAAFFFKDEKQSKAWSLVIAFASLAVMSFSLLSADNSLLQPGKVNMHHPIFFMV